VQSTLQDGISGCEGSRPALALFSTAVKVALPDLVAGRPLGSECGGSLQELRDAVVACRSASLAAGAGGPEAALIVFLAEEVCSALNASEGQSRQETKGLFGSFSRSVVEESSVVVSVDIVLQATIDRALAYYSEQALQGYSSELDQRLHGQPLFCHRAFIQEHEACRDAAMLGFQRRCNRLLGWSCETGQVLRQHQALVGSIGRKMSSALDDMDQRLEVMCRDAIEQKFQPVKAEVARQCAAIAEGDAAPDFPKMRSLWAQFSTSYKDGVQGPLADKVLQEFQHEVLLGFMEQLCNAQVAGANTARASGVQEMDAIQSRLTRSQARERELLAQVKALECQQRENNESTVRKRPTEIREAAAEMDSLAREMDALSLRCVAADQARRTAEREARAVADTASRDAVAASAARAREAREAEEAVVRKQAAWDAQVEELQREIGELKVTLARKDAQLARKTSGKSQWEDLLASMQSLAAAIQDSAATSMDDQPWVKEAAKLRRENTSLELRIQQYEGDRDRKRPESAFAPDVRAVYGDGEARSGISDAIASFCRRDARVVSLREEVAAAERAERAAISELTDCRRTVEKQTSAIGTLKELVASLDGNVGNSTAARTEMESSLGHWKLKCHGYRALLSLVRGCLENAERQRPREMRKVRDCLSADEQKTLASVVAFDDEGYSLLEGS